MQVGKDEMHPEAQIPFHTLTSSRYTIILFSLELYPFWGQSTLSKNEPFSQPEVDTVCLGLCTLFLLSCFSPVHPRGSSHLFMKML